MAEQVMRMNTPLASTVQRPTESEKLIQRKIDDGQVQSAPPIVHEVLHSPGQPLDAATGAFMESRFGHDFSRVRVHIDSKAVDSARAIQSRAYTMGADVVFGAGEYSPHSFAGRRLLAHELTHVVQQRGVAATKKVSSPQTLGPQRTLSDAAMLQTSAAPVVQRDRDRTQEEEEQRDEDRGDRRSTDRRRSTREERGERRDVFDDLDSDWAGRALLGHYFNGGGRGVDLWDQPPWTAYMTNSRLLQNQVWQKVGGMAKELVARGKPGSLPVANRFHAEVENGEGIIGYQYLHGTNKDVGDFLVVGFGEVTRFQGAHNALTVSQNPWLAPQLVKRGAGARVDFELRFIWNDKIDPNSTYGSDTVKSVIAEVITFGEAESYRLSISWKDKCSVWLPADGGQDVTGGYPSM